MLHVFLSRYTRGTCTPHKLISNKQIKVQGTRPWNPNVKRKTEAGVRSPVAEARKTSNGTLNTQIQGASPRQKARAWP